MKSHRILGVIALIIWGHLVVGLYPIPFQREAEIRDMARQAVSTQQDLQARGVTMPSASEEDWISSLTQDFWKGWISNLLLLALGIAAAAWALLGRRGWRWALVLPSAIVIYLTLGPVASDMVAKGPARWFEVWKIVTEKRLTGGEPVFPYLATLYHIFVWPLFHVGLIGAIGTLAVLTRSRRNSNILAA